MKSGDVCKCIADFNGTLSGELILCKNDIVQVSNSFFWVVMNAFHFLTGGWSSN